MPSLFWCSFWVFSDSPNCCRQTIVQLRKMLRQINVETFDKLSNNRSWVLGRRWAQKNTILGRTPKGAYSTRGRSRHLLETPPFSEPLLRTLLRTLSTVKPTSGPLLRTLLRTPSPEPFPERSQEPFLERCVAVRPLRRAPKYGESGGFTE